MLVINKMQTHLVAGQPLLLAEASEIGLPPGEWPDMISVVDDGGEGFLFHKQRQIQGGGWRYQTPDGRAALEVLND